MSSKKLGAQMFAKKKGGGAFRSLHLLFVVGGALVLGFYAGFHAREAADAFSSSSPRSREPGIFLHPMAPVPGPQNQDDAVRTPERQPAPERLAEREEAQPRDEPARPQQQDLQKLPQVKLVQWAQARDQCFQLAREGTDVFISVVREDRDWPACGATAGDNPGFAASFRVVDALDGTPGAFSLESCRHAKHYLRYNQMNVVVEPPKVPGDTVWQLPVAGSNERTCVELRAVHVSGASVNVDDAISPAGRVQMSQTNSMCLEMRAPKSASVAKSDCAANRVSDAVKVASMADNQPCSLIPSVKCPQILAGASIGEHSLCNTEGFKQDLRERTCLVYGIGVSDNWDFEVAMAEKGCEVHAFDPTIDKPPTNDGERLPNLHFHRWGLAMNSSESGSHKVAGTKSGATETSQPMLTVADIMQRLGHGNRRLSVFKVDCEGCEWASLSAIPGDLWDRIDQLSFELHYGTQLMLDSPEQLRRAAVVADALRSHKFGEWRSFVRDGYPQHRTLLPELYEAGMPKGYCCRLSGFVRLASLESSATAAPAPVAVRAGPELLQWSQARSECFHLGRAGSKVQLSVQGENRAWPACMAFPGDNPAFTASFRAVDAVDGSAEGVSLESCRHPGHFLRKNGNFVVVEPPKVPGDAVWRVQPRASDGCALFQAAHLQSHSLRVDTVVSPAGSVVMEQGDGQCLEMRKINSTGRLDKNACAAKDLSDAVKVASMADSQPCSLIPVKECPAPLEGSQIGEHALCKTQAMERDLRDGTCLVYGIGVSDNWDFEKAMAAKGCEVHAFDPTIDKPPSDESERLPNLHFHRWGLAMQTAESGSHKVAGTKSGATETSQPMLTLADMMERLGHSGRRLSAFKIDCEGCEWASLSVIPGNLWDRIDQLSFELHYGIELMLDSPEQLRRAATVADALQAHGFVDWRSDLRDGYPRHRQLLPELYEAGMPQGFCCRTSGYFRAGSSGS
mmetsp:Transcript_93823/g.171980  ORF Transcript_93823/g.171980 Transcript_93823/m.171980 type:complete len:965 (-) Transcript_93823:165-3059(-)